MAASAVGPTYIYRNVFHKPNYQWTSCVGVKYGRGGTGHVFFYHNVFYLTGDTCDDLQINDPNDDPDAGILGTGDGFVMAFSGGGLTSDNFTFWNNIQHFAKRQITAETTGGLPTNFSIDYNLNYDEDGGLYAKFGGTLYNSMAELAAGTGFEVNGVFGQAIFVDAANGDFNLTSTSPGINAGAVIQGFNDPVSAWAFHGSAPDMGAFENVAGPDTSTPFRYGGEPAGELLAGTASVTLAVGTGRVSECKYGTVASTTYAAMPNIFLNTTSTILTTTVSGLSDGASYTYYVRCEGDNGVVNDDDYTISFSIAVVDASPPNISNIVLIEDETSAVVQWNTDDASTSVVRFGTATNSLSQSITSTPLVTSHSIGLTGLTPDTQYYYEVESCNVDGFCSTSAIESFVTLVRADFAPTDDAAVFVSSPDLNLGSVSRLSVDSDTAKRAYLKFNVTGISGSIRSAKIKLYNKDASDKGGDIYHVPDTTWAESGITWNNKPPTEGPIIDSLGAVALNSVYFFDVTSRVTGNGVFAFAILSTSADQVEYDSKEGLNPPVLEIKSVARTLSIADVAVQEDVGDAVVTISLDNATTTVVTVQVDTTVGTAAAGQDYVAVVGATVSIPAGSTSTTTTIPILDDVIDEADETFTVTLSNATGGATISSAAGSSTVTILDNDPLRVLSIADTVVGEGDATAAVTVTLDGLSSFNVTVRYDTADASTTAGVDYAAKGATTTISAGSTSTTVTVDVLDDMIDELDETFTIALSDPINATTTGGSPTATVTIVDDDEPVVSIGDVAVGEAAGGATLTITADIAPAVDATVQVSTADGTAAASADYVATSTTATITAGTTSTTVTVSIADDSLDELNETFTVALSNPTNATTTGGSATATVTITDDDAPPSVSAPTAVSVAEGDSGTTTTVDIVVSLSTVSSFDVMVQYDTADLTASAAEGDYDAVVAGTLTVPAGNTTGTTQVVVNGDDVGEPNEAFTVTLSNATSSGAAATITQAATTVTIVDDDEPVVSIGDVAVGEAAGGATLTITTDIAPAVDATVQVSTADGTATAPADYGATSTTATITAGTTATTVTVSIADDSLDELNETFTVTLSNPTNATTTGGGVTATVTITDDDAPPSVSAPTAVSVVEGDSGTTTTVDIVVSLSTVSSFDVMVQYDTADLTASAAEGDYDAVVAGTLTVPAGNTTGTTQVVVKGDDVDEPNEAFTVTLSNATSSGAAATITQAATTVTIVDDDVPVVSIGDVAVGEAAGGATLTITTDIAPAVGATVQVSTADGTATASADYGATSTTATITAGTTSTTVTVSIADDSLDESNETFTVTLSNPTNATTTGGSATATVTITDDDVPVVSIALATVVEGPGVTATHAVTSDVAPVVDVVVTYITVDNGSATAGADFVSTTANTTIVAGTTMATATIGILDDNLDELNETTTVMLLSASGEATISATNGSAILTIVDAGVPLVSIAPSTVAEGNVNALPVVATDIAPAVDVVVTYVTIAAGSATAGLDFTSTTAVATILAGTTTTTAPVGILEDSLDELNETFVVKLLTATNSAISSTNGSATVTIVDDDVPVVSISPATVVEGPGVMATHAITSDIVPIVDVVVTYVTVENGSATAGADFVPTTANTTIVAGTTMATATIGILDDNLDEPNETTTAMLLSASGEATISASTGSAILTITDDDVPVVSIAPATVVEGSGVTATHAVTSDIVPIVDVVVTYFTVADGSAMAGVDFVSSTANTTIVAGTTMATATVGILDDNLDELNEITTIMLMSASGEATMSASNGSAILTIVDDDAPPTLMPVAAASVAEGNTGSTTTVEILVKLSATSGLDVMVHYATQDGTATSTDYVPVQDGMLNMPAGSMSATTSVTVIGDDIDEGNEVQTFSILWSGAMTPSTTTELVINPTSTTVTIIDDEALPTVDIPLAAGFNLIALPLAIQGGITAKALAETIDPNGLAQGGIVASILRFDAGFDAWLSDSPGENDFPIEHGRGYFVKLSAQHPAGKVTSYRPAVSCISLDHLCCWVQPDQRAVPRGCLRCQDPRRGHRPDRHSTGRYSRFHTEVRCWIRRLVVGLPR